MNIQDLILNPEDWVCKKLCTKNGSIYYILSTEPDVEGMTVPIPTASTAEAADEWKVVKIMNGEKESYLMTNDPRLDIEFDEN
jgi:hypothetical protein